MIKRAASSLQSLVPLVLIVTASAWVAPVRAEEAPKPAPESVVVKNGKAGFNGLLQMWAVNDTTNTGNAKLNFRPRRAEIKFTGSIVDEARWTVMVDAAKTINAGATAGVSADNKVLQDLFLTYDVAEGLQFSVGQFKVLTTTEGLDSSGELLFPERSMHARAYGDRREPGAALWYGQDFWKVGLNVSNGQGTNINDNTNAKDIALRAEAKPIDDVKVAAFTQGGDFKYRHKSRWGGDVTYTPGDVVARFFAIKAQDLGVQASGYTGDLGYKVGDRWLPIVRYDWLRQGSTTARVPTFGLNYFLKKHNSKIQASYSILNDATGGTLGNSPGSYSLSRNTKGSLFTLAFSTAI